MAGYVPNRILAGTVFPANWVASTAGAVTVKPLASQIQCPAPANIDTCDAAVDASPGGPIQIRTAANHGLATGDVVKISGVTGNVKVTLTSAGKKLIRAAVKKRKSLALTITMRFKDSAGRVSKTTKSVTLKTKKKK